jgi:acyl-CoA synthetase (AMP-forming)/AMP-acid ligase II
MQRAPDVGFLPTTATLVRRGAALFGDKPLIVTPEGQATYAEVEAASRRLARKLLAEGIGKGRRVGAVCGFGAEWLVTWLAVTRIGALFLPFSTACKPPELAQLLRQGDVDTLLLPRDLLGIERTGWLEQAIPGLAQSRAPLRCPAVPFLRRIWLAGAGPLPPWAARLDVLAPGDSDVDDALLEAVEAEVTPADLMVVIHTSGTTATPKGVVHTHGAMVRHGQAAARFLDLGPDDRMYCGMPFFWVGGIAFSIMSCMHVGATLLGMERFDAGTALDLMERMQATVMTGWPAVTGPLMAHESLSQRDIPALRHPFYAPGKPRKHHSLGMTETCGPHTGCFAATRDRPVPAGYTRSMGTPIPFMEHRIVDPETGTVLPDDHRGAIHVRGYSLMNGILKREREEVFTPDGWYDTGDEGLFHEGILYLTGRLSDMVKTSGNNVAPAEVEQALAALPGVQQAHVAGIPDAARGELVAAAIVLQPGATLCVEDLQAALRSQLSNYKVPRKFVFLRLEQVPWLPSGKVDRRRLKELLAQE